MYVSVCVCVCISLTLLLSLSLSLSLTLCVYIYIYRERDTDRQTHTHTHTHTNIYIIYIYIYIYFSFPHHHHVVPPARISLTLSRHFSLSFIASGRSSRLHPASSHSCCMSVRAGRPAFAWHMWGSIGVHHLWARPCFSSSVPRVWPV